MHPIGASSVVFVTLAGLFWGGWIVGSQTPQGQEAFAKALQMYTEQESAQEGDLFEPNALRALVCGEGAGALHGRSEKPCLAVAAAGRLFIVDAGSGASMALEHHRIPLGRLEAVLLTGADPVRAADLDELWVAAMGPREARPLPVYGPTDSHPVVAGLNQALAAQGAVGGLEAWAPAPEPDQPVVVFEADGLRVSAFTTQQDAFLGRIGYRFDYRGRSLVIGGDGQAEWAVAAQDADVVLNGAQSQMFAQLHNAEGSDSSADALQLASAARDAGAGMLVLTGVDPHPMIAEFQLRAARQSGMGDVVAGRTGLLVELPLTSDKINVRPL
jgi:ribonuclease Z